MKIFTLIYSIYGLIVFSSLFAIFSIPFVLGIWFKKFEKTAYWLHHVLARFFFAAIFIPVKIKLEKGVNLNNQYVIISNHFSFIDIPALAALNIQFKFIGKIAVNNIPLLGYIFKNLHIMVDREDKDSKKQTYLKSFKSIDEGYSMGISIISRNIISIVFESVFFSTWIISNSRNILNNINCINKR